MQLLGSDSFKALMEKAGMAIHSPKAFPLDDQSALGHDVPEGWLPVALARLVGDRYEFRAFCKEHRLSVPDCHEISSFAELSQKVMKIGRFPLALKSRLNSSGGKNTFRLEGFRELTRFWDKLQKNVPGPALLETWMDSKALIEVTLHSQGMSTSQIGLEQSLTGRIAWRLFPIAVPQPWNSSLDSVLGVFRELLAGAKGFIRLTLALGSSGISLLALNAGGNRLEYFPGWDAGLLDNGALVANCLGVPLGSETPSPKGKFARLGMLRRSAKTGNFPSQLPNEARSERVIRYETSGRFAALLLCGNDPQKLSQEARTIATLLNSGEEAE